MRPIVEAVSLICIVYHVINVRIFLRASEKKSVKNQLTVIK